jgi:hypothetical protein
VVAVAVAVAVGDGDDDAAGIIITVEEEEEEEGMASMNAAASWISRRGTILPVRVAICGSEGNHSKRIYTKYVN